MPWASGAEHCALRIDGIRQFTMRWREARARFQSMPNAGRTAFFVACALLPVVGAALRLRGFARVNRFLQRVVPVRPRPAPSDLELRAICRAVNAAARHGPYRATCLARTLLLRAMVARLGVAGVLRIGVRLDAGELDAHAWLEIDGRPANDHGDIGREFLAFEQS